MRRMHFWAVALLTPFLAFAFVVTTGCGSKDTGGSAENKEKKEKTEKKDTKDKTGASLTAVEGKYTGTLKGKVTLAGDKPDIAALDKVIEGSIKDEQKKDCIKDVPDDQKDQKGQQVWRIGKDNSVANVIVYIQPAKGSFFKVDMENPIFEEKKTIDQPHCAFVPHVVVLFSKYRDPANPKAPKRTKQTFTVKNSATFSHNTNLNYPGGINPIIASKGHQDIDLDSFPLNKDVPLSCNIHGWMKSHVWAFDHPYAAVTKEDGTFEIKGVPVGAKVKIYAWHEVSGWVNKEGEEIELKDETVKDFEVKKE